MQLIAVPFTPTYAEYIFLKGRRVLADQMEYLLAHFPRTSPLHARIRAYWFNARMGHPVTMLAAARQERGLGAPLAACGGGHIPVPDQRVHLLSSAA